MLTAENFDNKIKECWPKNGPPTQEIAKYIKKYSKEKIVIKYKVPKRKDRLFRSKNYNARIGAEEKKFLMEVA